MRALTFDGSRLSLAERAEPTATEELAVVRVALAGICNTDLEIARGYMGFRGTLGHEFVGRVVEGPEIWRGARVVSEINFACGRCETCERGLGRHCPRRRVLGILDADGAFADLAAVPVANLHRVPDGVSDEEAVFAEPLAAAFEILEQVTVTPEMRCVVLGDGKLGLLAAQVLAQTGARVRAVGKHAEKLAVLAARGVETTLLQDWGADDRADLVVEATGSAEGLAHALRATRPRGRLVLKTTLAEAGRIDLSPVVIDEIQLVGSRCGPFEPALAALAAGRVDVGALVAERFDLSKGVDAFERAASPGTLKVLLVAG